MHGTFTEHSEPPRRLIRRSSDWTLKEHEVMVSHWPDRETITRLLPHRSPAAIRKFAVKCNLVEPLFVWSEGQTRLLRTRVKEHVPVKLIAKELRLTKLQVTNKMRYLNLTYGRRPPAPTGHPLMDAIYLRAFELNISRKDLDEACNSGGQFGRWSPARKISIKHIVRAVKALDGQLTVEWSNARD